MRTLLVRVMLGAVAFMAAPVEAQTHRLSLNVGAFSLQGEDTRIDDDVVVENLGLFAFTVDDFRGGSVGAEWLVETGDFLEVGVGVGFYRKTVLSVYNDFVNDDGTEIPQDFKLRVTPMTASVRFFPFSLGEPVQPYGGVGIGLFNWRYSEVGEFIDFNTFDVFRDRFVASGNDVGLVYLAGIRFQMSERFGIGGEVRYQDVIGAVGIDQGFLDERIDLGGLTSSLTVSIGF
ncbi:MAG: hypothetical protein CL483_05335 [Acidobacteria bacterium]|nr:hypothetical protein [Acidobacteriota bacterium]